MDFLDEAGMLCGWVLTDQPSYSIADGQPNYSSSMCAYPQMSIDASDNIFVASSTLAPDYTNGEYYYRHIIANSSYDLGNSWVGMIDLNEDIQYIFSECAYPEMAPFIDDYVHVVFQEDPFPGIAEWLTNHDAVENNIRHMAIDKNVFVGLKENHQVTTFDLSTYPNPASEVLYLGLDLQQNAGVTVQFLNTMGKIVTSKDMGNLIAGMNKTSLDISGLPSGIYYLRARVGTESMTKKVVVQ